MSFTQRIIIAAAAIVAVVVSAGPAMAHGYDGTAGNMYGSSGSYSGSWPVTITGSQRSNGTGCLTLSGRGSASLAFGTQKYTYGSFVLVNDILVVNIVEPLYGQNGALMFIAHANRARIGRGVFENIEGGSNFDYGALTFGMKNGC